jgi:hypothetical protein
MFPATERRIMTVGCYPGLAPETGLAEWDFYPENSAPKRWARELADTIADGLEDREHWNMIGRGVLLEAEDHEFAIEVVRHIASVSGFQLVEIPREDVWAEFEAWMAEFTDSSQVTEPVMLYLEPGIWLTAANEDIKASLRFPPEPDHDPGRGAAFRRELTRFMLNCERDRPLVVVSSVKALEQADESLRRVGAFDRYIGLPDLLPKDLAAAFVRSTGQDLFGDATVADTARLGRFLEAEYGESRRRLKLLQLGIRRLAIREARKVEFRDLMAFALYGSLERDARLSDGETAWRTAVHEAGHVLVRYLSDPFGTIPEYCGIMEWDNMLGVTVDCYSSRVNSFHQKTWQDMIANVRVTLGGRAAEHLVFGVTGLSVAGSRSDLEGVTSAVRAMIEDFGLPLRDGTFDEALDHLMVSSGVLSPSESAYNEFRIREFIRWEYTECFRLLEEHRTLLLRLAEEIRSRVILDQQDLRQILEKTPLESQDTVSLPHAA